MLKLVTAADWPRIQALHKEGGFGFELPPQSQVLSPYMVEQDGEILAMAGVRLVAEVVAVTNQRIRAHVRNEAMKALYGPVAQAVLGAQTISGVYAFPDPKFKNFDRRMMRMGWGRKLWPCMYLDRQEIEGAYANLSQNCH